MADELDRLTEATEGKRRRKDRRKACQQAWLLRRDTAMRAAMAKFQQLELAEVERLAWDAEVQAHKVKRGKALERLEELREKFAVMEVARKVSGCEQGEGWCCLCWLLCARIERRK